MNSNVQSFLLSNKYIFNIYIYFVIFFPIRFSFFFFFLHHVTGELPSFESNLRKRFDGGPDDRHYDGVNYLLEEFVETSMCVLLYLCSVTRMCVLLYLCSVIRMCILLYLCSVTRMCVFYCICVV